MKTTESQNLEGRKQNIESIPMVEKKIDSNKNLTPRNTDSGYWFLTIAEKTILDDRRNSKSDGRTKETQDKKGT